MAGFPITTQGPMTAADWTAQNPVLPQFQIGIEINAATGAYGPMKMGDGVTAWNSLAYVGGSVVQLLAATTVDLSVATKQNGYTVPTGKICIPSHFIVTNASIDLSGTAASCTAGWDAGAVNIFPSNGDGLYAFAAPMFQQLTTSVKAVGRSVFLDRSVDGSTVDAAATQFTIGVAGDVLGFLCSTTDTGTVKVYSFGTLVDA